MPISESLIKATTRSGVIVVGVAIVKTISTIMEFVPTITAMVVLIRRKQYCNAISLQSQNCPNDDMVMYATLYSSQWWMVAGIKHDIAGDVGIVKWNWTDKSISGIHLLP